MQACLSRISTLIDSVGLYGEWRIPSRNILQEILSDMEALAGAGDVSPVTRRAFDEVVARLSRSFHESGDDVIVEWGAKALPRLAAVARRFEFEGAGADDVGRTPMSSTIVEPDGAAWPLPAEPFVGDTAAGTLDETSDFQAAQAIVVEALKEVEDALSHTSGAPIADATTSKSVDVNAEAPTEAMAAESRAIVVKSKARVAGGTRKAKSKQPSGTGKAAAEARDAITRATLFRPEVHMRITPCDRCTSSKVERSCFFPRDPTILPAMKCTSCRRDKKTCHGEHTRSEKWIGPVVNEGDAGEEPELDELAGDDEVEVIKISGRDPNVAEGGADDDAVEIVGFAGRDSHVAEGGDKTNPVIVNSPRSPIHSFSDGFAPRAGSPVRIDFSPPPSPHVFYRPPPRDSFVPMPTVPAKRRGDSFESRRTVAPPASPVRAPGPSSSHAPVAPIALGTLQIPRAPPIVDLQSPFGTGLIEQTAALVTFLRSALDVDYERTRSIHRFVRECMCQDVSARATALNFAAQTTRFLERFPTGPDPFEGASLGDLRFLDELISHLNHVAGLRAAPRDESMPPAIDFSPAFWAAVESLSEALFRFGHTV